MLPILRTISVGGVLLAITILGLALIPPSRTNLQLAAGESPARGALIDRLSHPEWRQFLIMSALRRADEVEKLRDLPGMPNGVSEPPAARGEPQARLAGLPSARGETDPDDETGSINVAPSATMPIDIGETSSFELPVSPAEERLPVSTVPAVSAATSIAAPAETVAPAVTPAPAATPDIPVSKVAALATAEQPKPVVIIRKRTVRKPAPKPPLATPQAEITAPPPFNLFQAFFASLAGKPVASAEQPAKPVTLRQPRSKAKKTAGLR